MSDLNKLLTRAKCTVHITVNQHRNYYNTAEEALEEYASYECPPQIEDDVRAEMIRTDTIVNVQFYPDTPIGSYDVYHYDFDECVRQAWACVSEHTETTNGS